MDYKINLILNTRLMRSIIYFLLFYLFSIVLAEKATDLKDPLLIWPRPKDYTVGDFSTNETRKIIDPC